MMDLDAVAAAALALPEVTEGERYGWRTWFVRKKGFVWERPFTKADLKRFGAEVPPSGPILGVMVEDLAEKEAVLAAGTPGVFTIEHFRNYPAVLVQLEVVSAQTVHDLVVDAWLAVAPRTLADAHAARLLNPPG